MCQMTSQAQLIEPVLFSTALHGILHETAKDFGSLENLFTCLLRVIVVKKTMQFP